MYKTLYILASLTTLSAGLFCSLTASSWVTAWLGLELSLMSFLPAMVMSSASLGGPLKYFLIQSCASLAILQLSFLSGGHYPMVLLPGLVLKLGAAPLHFWFPSMANSLTWEMNLLLLTAQKLPPLYLVSVLSPPSGALWLLAAVGALVGGVGGLSYNSLRKILAMSSVSHMGWIFSAMLAPGQLWCPYFAIYVMMTLSVILSLAPSNTSFLSEVSATNGPPKTSVLVPLLSMSGFPPLAGFFPKWAVVTSLVPLTPSLALTLVLLSAVSLYMYLKIILLGAVKTPPLIGGSLGPAYPKNTPSYSLLLPVAEASLAWAIFSLLL